MKPSYKRKIIYVILTSFLLFATFLIIMLVNKNNPKQEMDFQKEVITNNNITIYGNPDDEDIEQQQTLVEEQKPIDYMNTEETIFQMSSNTSSISSYNLSKPILIENAKFDGFPVQIMGIKDGSVYVHSNNNDILFYNPKEDKTLSLTNNVSKIYPTRNNDFLLFEKKLNSGVSLYQFNFVENKNGFEEIVKLANSGSSFGVIRDFNYFSTVETPNTTYYQPMPKSSAESSVIGFNNIKGTKHDLYRDNLISYNPENKGLFELTPGEGQKELEKIPVEDKFNHIVHLKTNQHREDKLVYITSFSEVEGSDIGTKVFINGVESPDLVNILDLEWVDRESIIYQVDSPDGELYIYNFRTQEKFILDKKVFTFGFDSTEKAIYYIKSTQPNLQKIVFNEKE